MQEELPIVNCHTHIFTADHVPPYLAKTILPSFIQWVFHLGFIVSLFKAWYKGPGKWRFKPSGKGLTGLIYAIRMLIARTIIINIIYWLIGIWLLIQVVFYMLDWSDIGLTINNSYIQVHRWLIDHYIYVIGISTCYKVLFILTLFAFFPSFRNLLLFIAKKIFKVLGALPGKQTKELLQRYLNIGRFAFHEKQDTIFNRLRYQYPDKSKFIVLPMDMTYMQAGKVKEDYRTQMNKIAVIKAKKVYKDIIYPFVFVDPRRIEQEPDFFKYIIKGNKVVLEDCFIKNFIEDRQFCGFKIYPALGYYVFDKHLLALWKYAQQNNLPIMTHCIRGTIFYRGAKKKEWDKHPIFEQAIGDKNYEPLLLPEIKNMDFCNNFTHPLNYLCLLNESLLIKVLKLSADPKIQGLFGYTEGCKKLTSNLSELKICLAHYGGEDEWQRYFELDRDNYSTQIIKNPDWGINFLTNKDGVSRPGKIEQIWKSCDWYSIICSLMLQYENIYADISYISHDNAIHALLKRTLNPSNGKLRKRVLFGTDFYVVRNHKSEKQIMADTLGGLSVEEFNLIARTNPICYLNSKIVNIGVCKDDKTKDASSPPA